MLSSNKRGQTLVEVVVALGILAMVFAGVVTLIVRVVDLELMARDRTVAVSLAQKKLAETVGNLGDGCNVSDYTIPNGSIVEGSKTFNYSGAINNSFDYSNELNNKNFVEITIKVDWQEKSGSVSKYELKQVVRK